MLRKIDYQTTGTCSTLIHLEVEDDTIVKVSFTGGCNGNLQGICSLVQGMKTSDVLKRLEGIRCGYKQTSCPDQLCAAIRELTQQS